MNEILHISDLDFEIRRSARRKTLGLTVDRRGELVVHAPATVEAGELQRWITRKLLWVHQKLALKNEMAGAAQQPEFVSGESIFYLGRNYRLRVVARQEAPLHFDGQWFRLRRDQRPLASGHFREWYLVTGTQWIQNRVMAWHPKVGVFPGRINLGDLGYRWGSCGKRGAVHFNWRLLQLPVRLIDYVIVHELAHLIEHNHTRQFWQILDRVLPDWRERKKAMETEWQAYAAFGVEHGPSDSV